MNEWDRHVTPHGDLVQLDTRLWEVAASAPKGPLARTMTVYRLDDGGLLIHGAHALRPETMTAIEALGEPRLMIVASTFHEMHESLYKQRYPHLVVACPGVPRAKLQRLVPIDLAAEDLGARYGITVHSPDGVKPVECCYELPLGDGVALIFGDMLMNLPDFAGFQGWLLHAIGSTGFFGMTGMGRMLMLKDRAAFRGWLERMAARPDLRVLSVGHGATIRHACDVQLRKAAARL
ncbi:MAG: hypothetical protein H7338_09755 [Candidatus Sericytochromatia bacterium]|nr:hypothetical protein [Candidatus Sericytochromatia bacterium]